MQTKDNIDLSLPVQSVNKSIVIMPIIFVLVVVPVVLRVHPNVMTSMHVPLVCVPMQKKRRVTLRVHVNVSPSAVLRFAAKIINKTHVLMLVGKIPAKAMRTDVCVNHRI